MFAFISTGHKNLGSSSANRSSCRPQSVPRQPEAWQAFCQCKSLGLRRAQVVRSQLKQEPKQRSYLNPSIIILMAMVDGSASNSSSGSPAFFRASAARSSAAKSSGSEEAPSEESSPASSVGRKASAAGSVADCYILLVETR